MFINENFASIDEYLWKNDEFLYGLESFITNIRVLSLDIFDTLLFRTCNHPHDVFLEVGIQAIKRNLIHPVITAKEFQQVRILAEEKARSINKRENDSIEVTLKDIYANIPQAVGSVPELVDLEIECEKHCCYLNPSISSLVRYAKENNIPVVLLSDMYLSSEQIIQILNNSGFKTEYIDLLLVSNEVGGGKSDGYLFKKLMSLYSGINSKAILHIGDNKEADVNGAQKFNIRSLHYNVVPREADTVFEAENIRHGLLLQEIRSLRKLAGNLTAAYSGDEKYWFRIGATVMGPFLSAFCDWIIDICINENKKAIYPFMREGALFSLLISKAAERRNIHLEIRPLYISRQSTFLASLDTFDDSVIEKFFERINFSLEDLLVSLQLDKDFELLPEYSNVYLNESYKIILDSGQKLSDYIIAYLKRPDIIVHVNNLIKSNRKKLVMYLTQECPHLCDCVTVDLGFNGTIQTSIESALHFSGLKVNMMHLLALGGEKTKRHLLNGMDIRGFCGNAGENIDLIRTIIKSDHLLEQLMMMGEGSTVEYRQRIDGTVIPITADNSLAESEILMREICRDGILTYQKLWHYLCARKPALRQLLLNKKRDISMIVHRMVDMPTYYEAKSMGKLYYDVNYGSSFSSQICKETDINLLNQIGPEKFLSTANLSVIWPQGVITNQYPEYILKHYITNWNASGYLAMMNQLVQRVLQEDIREIIIYGAGEVGENLLRASKLNSLKVICIVDRKKTLWGSFIEDTEIISLEEAVIKGNHTYVIGSLAFIDDIEKTIKEKYAGTKIIPQIFHIQVF